MGYGDQLMATGMARGARERGKRIAFGEGGRLWWDHYSKSFYFQGNLTSLILEARERSRRCRMDTLSNPAVQVGNYNHHDTVKQAIGYEAPISRF